MYLPCQARAFIHSGHGNSLSSLKGCLIFFEKREEEIEKMQGGRRNGDMSIFSDPFGSMSGRSVFSSVFDRDPFDDPFFKRPFGSAFGSRSIFGPEGFFDKHNVFFDDQEYQEPQSARRGPVIEELPDDHEEGRHNSSQEPIVEDPDDDQVNTGQRTQRQRENQSVFQGSNNTYPRQSSSQTFSFRSSKVTYGGQNGAYYTSSTTRRMGPDGVTHEEHMEADTTTGNATKRISRGIKDKGHSITKKLNSDGRVETKEILHNMDEDEIDLFDNEWNTKADEALPGWKESHAQMLDTGRSGMRNVPSKPALLGPSPKTSKQDKQSQDVLDVPLSNSKREAKRSHRDNKENKQSHSDNSSRRWFGLRKG